jgi:hypothetical protein
VSSETFILGGPGLPSGVPSGIAVRVDPNPGPGASALELVVHSPSAPLLDAHEVATAVGGAIARLVWNTDGPPAAEGTEHEEERFMQAQLIGDLERWLRQRGGLR